MDRIRGLSGVKIDLSVALASDGDGSSARLPPDVESALYRLVQEALSNVIKHAGATRVEVRVVERDRSVSVTVRDDGRGFDPDLDHRGFGLLGMRERVFLMKGTIDIDSARGRGTTVRGAAAGRAETGAEGRRASRWRRPAGRCLTAPRSRSGTPTAAPAGGEAAG